ncbi:3053_t:CDS:10 [Scutellospora calospora]|uniref:3053_t:CDS:1 n=1 Tax=Scutellospora calospora TaxID=85575 RepID=A0ACA9JVF5_9GLOM|nr:3053_t:CDS:10 [Scutellospora calospora]
MSTLELESLIKEPDESAISAHVVDFLNAHFKELEDLGKLNTILSEVKSDEQKLNENCVKVQSKTSEILKHSLQAFNSTVTKLEDFQATRLELEDVLTDHCNIVTSSNSLSLQENFSNEKTLMDELVMLQQQVDSLERSKQYLKVLVVAEELSAQTKHLIERSPRKALNPYIQLANLLHSIKSKSKDAGHVVTHLDVFLQQSVDVLWEDMKNKLKKKFQQSLDALNWPTPIKLHDPQVTTDKLSSFKKAFTELLLLQRPIIITDESTSTKPSSSIDQNDELPPLLPIQIMVEPLIVRFRYHFDSKRPTSRIDKPEWYFSHVITTIHEHSPFLTGAIQAIVDEAGFQEYHAKNDFIRCLLVAVTRKLTQSVPTLLKSPQIFSHTVFETLQFDQTLRELHMYIPPGQKEWKGCVEVFTGKKETFKAWLKVEKEFAEVRYNEIMHSEDAWELIDVDVPEDEFRPTKSSGKLTNLLELITSRYKLLPMFHNRIRFLVDIQAELLMSYAKRIDSAVDAFEKSISYSFVRSVPSTASADGKSHSGIEDLKRLCRWLNSAGFVSRTIKEWGEDSFFLELWHEVTLRASRNTGSSPFLSPTSSESSDQLQESSSVHKEELITVDEGTVFDDPAGLFDSSCEKIQLLIIKNVSKGFFNGSKAYYRKNNWSRTDIYNLDPVIISQQPLFKQAEVSASSNDDKINIEIELSPELYTPLSDLAHSLTFLSNHLPARVFKYLYKEISKEIEDYLWNRILMGNQFSEMGGRQFEVDMEKGLFTIGKRWVQKPENYFRRLKDACILLTIPSSYQITSVVKQNNSIHQKTLSQIMRILFDNELESTEIRKMLESLCVYHLSPKEAKDVIRRRVECWK